MHPVMESFKALVLAQVGKSNVKVKIELGQLEQVFTGLQQAFIVIAICLFVLGILMVFFPGLRRFLGGLL